MCSLIHSFHNKGLSAKARTVFRIVTALAPPFVMESELDEDGLCLRGLPCHRVSPIGKTFFDNILDHDLKNKI